MSASQFLTQPSRDWASWEIAEASTASPASRLVAVHRRQLALNTLLDRTPER